MTFRTLTKHVLLVLLLLFSWGAQAGTADTCMRRGSVESLPGYQFIGEQANDYAGYWVSSAGDVDGDGLADTLIGAYDNSEGGQSAGAVYLILGKNLGQFHKSDLSLADYKFIGEDSGDWAGIQASSAGDVDGDGLDDVLVGAYGEDTMGSKTGAAYVVLGKSLGSNKIVDLSQANFKLVGENEDDYAGYAVAKAGDVDGDDLDDIIIGASGVDGTGKNSGAVYIILGRTLGPKRVVSLAEADYKFNGESRGNWAGYLISGGGDVDGDGLNDIFIGSDSDDGGREAHASYVILGRNLAAKGAYNLSQSDYKLIGVTAYDYASQVSINGDVNGDGLDDLVIGAAGNDKAGDAAGIVYVVLGSSLGGSQRIDLSNADYELIGENAGDNVGAHVAHAGDIDGDGLDDIMIGALRYTGKYK